MVLGLRGKSRKGTSEQVDYLIHVQDIKPWPPLQSLKSTQSILLQWENGGRSSGSFTSGAEDGKVEFNESFSLSVTLCREASKKSTSSDSFQKNYLEFYLYEPRKDKAMKGQLLGTAIINLSDHGIIKENIIISSPINLKKSSKNMAQPILYISIQPIDRDSCSSSPKSNLSRKISTDKDGSESISELMNEEEEVGVDSFTDDDDDVSSHSSQTVSSSALENARRVHAQNNKDEYELQNDGTGKVRWEPTIPLDVESANPEVKPVTAEGKHLKVTSSQFSSRNLSSDPRNPLKDLSYPPKFPERSLTSIQKTSVTHSVQHKHGDSGNYARMSGSDNINSESSIIEDRGKKEQLDNGLEKRNLDDFVGKFSRDVMRKQVRLRSNTLAFSREATGAQSSVYTSDKIKHMKSVQFDPGSAGGTELFDNSKLVEKERETYVPEDAHNGVMSYESPETEKKTTNSFSDNKLEMESKLEMLEEELREAAAVEVGLYSVIAEHGSSTNKVHAPARRLSRFYFHVCKAKSQAKRANAARAAVSGLVLVSKACGNDVPRLTFWLSNAIVLRAIISQMVGKTQISAGTCINLNGDETGLPTPHKSVESFDEWEDPQTFIIALEKVEAWIFSRIVESVWWQTLTPYMQPSTANGSSMTKKYGRKYGLRDQEQGNFSVELWKRAFKDACERLCPIRAGGHECGCLPVLAKLVMQQLVGRLDVAMFNAILRESAEEMPTDPVSDPISDWKVLPIPASKSSFGAGAQLKNAIGNWSRWLTDLFDIDENDSPPVENELSDETRMECEPPFKAFHLLNSLSDLMMLPFELLADKSTRKEVCPTFSAALIRRVLSNYVPDEYSPDPIPDTVLDALDSEDLSESEGEFIAIPCIATMTVYSPSSATSLIGLIGEVGGPTLLRNSSSVLKKSYTSDDELDELDSPISSIVTDNSKVSLASSYNNPFPKGKANRKVVRYQLLREVWKDGK